MTSQHGEWVDMFIDKATCGLQNDAKDEEYKDEYGTIPLSSVIGALGTVVMHPFYEARVAFYDDRIITFETS